MGSNNKSHRLACIQPSARSIKEIIRRVESSNFKYGGPHLDLQIIRKVHRGGDGFVVFARKAEGERFHLYAIERKYFNRHLNKTERKLFTQCLKRLNVDLKRDAYWSLHSFFTDRGPTHKNPLLRVPRRKQKDIRRLNCCFVDLDTHALELDFETVLKAVRLKVRRGEVPKPSIIVQSGRGVWLLWLLEDPNTPSLGPRGDPVHYRRNFFWWKTIEAALIERFTCVGVDKSAQCGARMIRVPGSVNSKGRSRVIYWPVVDAKGRLLSYTLREMGRRLNVAYEHKEPSPSQPVEPRRTKTAATSRAKSGFINLAESRVRQLYTLEKLRGGFRKGTRSFAVLYLAAFLRQTGQPHQVVWKVASELGERCQPPLSPSEIGHQIRSSYGFNNFQNDLISEFLHITEDEANHLETWKASPAFQKPSVSRRALVCGLIADFLNAMKRKERQPRFPSIKTLRAYLDEFGVTCPRSGLYNYLAYLDVRPGQKLSTSRLQDLIDVARSAC